MITSGGNSLDTRRYGDSNRQVIHKDNRWASVGIQVYSPNRDNSLNFHLDAITLNENIDLILEAWAQTDLPSRCELKLYISFKDGVEAEPYPHVVISKLHKSGVSYGSDGELTYKGLSFKIAQHVSQGIFNNEGYRARYSLTIYSKVESFNSKLIDPLISALFDADVISIPRYII